MHSKGFSRECDSARLSLSVSSPQNKMLSSGRQICSRLLRPVCCSRKRKKNTETSRRFVSASQPPSHPGVALFPLTRRFLFFSFLPDFEGFFLLSFYQIFFLTRSYRVLHRFSRVTLSFSWSDLGLSWVVIISTSFTGFQRVLLGFTGFYRVLPGFTGFSLISSV